jgi:hypothetical protein
MTLDFKGFFLNKNYRQREINDLDSLGSRRWVRRQRDADRRVGQYHQCRYLRVAWQAGHIYGFCTIWLAFGRSANRCFGDLRPGANPLYGLKKDNLITPLRWYSFTLSSIISCVSKTDAY